MIHICKVEDDAGNICGSVVGPKQWAQDGMCARCAEGIWSSVLPHRETPFFFKDWPKENFLDVDDEKEEE